MYKRKSSLQMMISVNGHAGKRNSSAPEIRYSKAEHDNVEIRFFDAHFDLNNHWNPQQDSDQVTQMTKVQGQGEKLTTETADKTLCNTPEYKQHLQSTLNKENMDVTDGSETYERFAIPLNIPDNLKEFDITSEADLQRKGMVKGHYVDKKLKKTCNGCQKQFKLKRKPKHCRRCGEVFCLKCVKYRRKLNSLANPDPEGKIRKVCKECFEGDSLVLGCTNSLTDEFSNERSLAKYARVINKRVNSLTTTFWPDQIDRQAECMRLLTGFQQEVKQLGSVNALQPLKVILKTPAWQKSKYWDIEIQATKCRSCKGDVGLRKSSGNCRVCGLALCRKCSHKELLLFYENGDITAEARLAIIHVPGAPAHEPDISLLLYVCLDCKTHISRQQQSDLLWYTCGVDRGIVDDLIDADAKFEDVKRKIEASILKVEEFLDKVSCRELSSAARNASAEIMTLRTTLNKYEKELKLVRSWMDQTLTRTETTLLENYIKSRYEFYMDQRYKCRTLGNKLDAGRNRNDA
ncbi:RUN and FYVE domain-containing protein 2-like isoform X2 [Mercenaria mercenaria]|uniref:RUN and FYVE domain-containing protein 2-like isoform X2 n=1 Tax=Mercenaria mercenaria TaxID=6596 RepID=UPI00234F093B|nr:RUN and FYVE domain-containing protein 2-like isoform X2 [Mercenaria mercenaria]